MKNRHIWSVDDDKVACEAYLAGLSKNDADKIARSRRIKIKSFMMKIDNFKYLATDGQKGLSNCSKQSQQVWEEYKKSGKL